MAEHRSVPLSQLDAPFVLAPERYDPRRQLPWTGPPLSSLVRFSSETARGQAEAWRVLDTGHAQEGIARPPVRLVESGRLGSQKRVLRPGDLILSRLRPYLRQLAWVDPGLLLDLPDGAGIAASTEFYVLRPRDGDSLAFLVPLLLSAPVQRALAAAQEGGHHPRVPRHFIEQLPVPPSWLARRAPLSAEVEAAIGESRRASQILAALSEAADPESAPG